MTQGIDLNNSGCILAKAAKTVDSNGNPIPIDQQSDTYVALVPIEINYAQGTQKDREASQIAVWTPNDGIGKGEPIYSAPSPDLQITFSGGSMSVTFLGNTYQLSSSSSNPLLYATADQAVSVQLSEAPLNDPNVVEAFTATVNQPAVGVQGAVYNCQETSASSSVFSNVMQGVVMTLGTNAMTLELDGADGSTQTYQLQATNQPNSFSGTGINATLVNNPALTNSVDTMYVSITCADFQLSNSVFTVTETGTNTDVFRNFAEPVPTDLGMQPVPDIAPVYLQVPKSFVSQAQAGTNATNGANQGTVLHLLTKMQDGSWQSLVLLRYVLRLGQNFTILFRGERGGPYGNGQKTPTRYHLRLSHLRYITE